MRKILVQEGRGNIVERYWFKKEEEMQKILLQEGRGNIVDIGTRRKRKCRRYWYRKEEET